MEVVRLDMVECGEAFSWVIASLAMAMAMFVSAKLLTQTLPMSMPVAGPMLFVVPLFFTDFQFMGTGKV